MVGSVVSAQIARLGGSVGGKSPEVKRLEAGSEEADLLEGLCELLGSKKRGESGQIGERDLPVGASREGEVFDAGVGGEVSKRAGAFDGVEKAAEMVDQLVLKSALAGPDTTFTDSANRRSCQFTALDDAVDKLVVAELDVSLHLFLLVGRERLEG